MKYFIIILFSFFTENISSQEIVSGSFRIDINEKMQTLLTNLEKGSIALMANYSESEYLITRHEKLEDYKLISTSVNDFIENKSKGKKYTFIGSNKNGIEKILTIKVYDQSKNYFASQTIFINKSNNDYPIVKYVTNDYTIKSNNDIPAFYSFQGGSTGDRKDWILPVDSNFFQQNYMGMNGSDYGGGIPVSDLWRKDIGIAIGHLETLAQLVSFPVEYNLETQSARTWMEYNFQDNYIFEPNDTIYTLETFVTMHHGDCFEPLQNFSVTMQQKGLVFPKSQHSAYEPIWCAWGYEREFTLDEIIATLPKVKSLGFKWVGLDDGFQIDQGNWHLNKIKFPNGTADMLKFTKAVHDLGMKAQIWWAPLAVSPKSDFLNLNPNILLRNPDYSPQFITWWDSWYMAPSDSVVIKHTIETVKMFLTDWDFDGLKLDGQHMNFCPADNGENHGIENPEDAFQKLPDFFKIIHTTAHKIKPDALVQFCPCGCCINFYNLEAIDQTVSSDPTSSYQVRSKGLVYKAISPDIAYFGDHVELSDNKNDFASSFGVGAVLGTKFTYPKDNPKQSESFLLTPEKEIVWRHWMQLYDKKMLSRGKYLGNLYDIGFDKPETHLIEKNNNFYYSFYAKEWNGTIVLKGLQKNKNYTVYDYVNDREIAKISGANPIIKVEFINNLLVEVKEN